MKNIFEFILRSRCKHSWSLNKGGEVSPQAYDAEDLLDRLDKRLLWEAKGSNISAAVCFSKWMSQAIYRRDPCHQNRYIPLLLFGEIQRHCLKITIAITFLNL